MMDGILDKAMGLYLQAKKTASKDRLFLQKTAKGFTLIEIIVALAVLSVAITGLVQMFSLSLNLSQTSQNVILASSIAHDKLNYVLNCPDKFVFKIYGNLKPGEVFSILTSIDEPKAGNTIETPMIAPPDWASFRKYKNVSQKFHWKAFGKIPDNNPDCYEIIVAVIYNERGKTKYYMENSVIPRFQFNKVINK